MSTIEHFATGVIEFLTVDDEKVVRLTHEKSPLAVWYAPTNVGFAYVGDPKSHEYEALYKAREPSSHSPRPAQQG